MTLGTDDVATVTRATRVRAVKLAEEQVEKKGDSFVLKENPTIRVDARAYKMSKSRGNVINPDDVVNEYGADSLRLYEMFMGPLEATKPWSMRGVEGVYRFLGRVWRLFIDERAEETRLAETVKDVPPERETLRKLHQTIQKVTDDLDGMRFNTAIAAMMEFTNHLTPLTVRPRSVLEPFVLLLSPFAPHLAEELWRRPGPQGDAGLRAVAGLRPGAGEGRRDRGAGADQRQGASAADGPGRRGRGDAEGAGPGRPEGARAARRQGAAKVIVVPKKLVNIVV